MPGYKALPKFMTGDAADQVREAESRQRVGDSATAVRLLEDALDASATGRAELPGWLCGRLAALYRTLGRYDDEVQLLERYRESQTSEESRTRYDARLSKARTIAERKRRPESGALASVRASLDRPRPRRTPAAPVAVAPAATGPRPSDAAIDAAAIAISLTESDDDERVLAALARLGSETTAAGGCVEQLVAALQEACTRPPVAALPAEARAARYGSALVRALAIHFEEAPSL